MFTLTKRVLPQHTDYAGVMWHGAYVQWLEEARVEALQAAGLGYAAMTAMGVDMPVVSPTPRWVHRFWPNSRDGLQHQSLPQDH